VGEQRGDQPVPRPLLEIDQGAFEKTLVANTWAIGGHRAGAMKSRTWASGEAVVNMCDRTAERRFYGVRGLCGQQGRARLDHTLSGPGARADGVRVNAVGPGLVKTFQLRSSGRPPRTAFIVTASLCAKLG